MSFIWTRKLAERTQSAVSTPTKEEPPTEQAIEMPVYKPELDKISVTEHKNGECLASSREEDDEVGGGEEEVDGQEVVLPRTEDGEVVVQEGVAHGEEDSSPLASLKK